MVAHMYVKVELPLGKVGTYKRVGGTPLGGGTFLALGCLLTGAKSHQVCLMYRPYMSALHVLMCLFGARASANWGQEPGRICWRWRRAMALMDR